MSTGYVQVAPDSTGKYIRNESLYVPVDLFDGTGPIPTLVQQQVVTPADSFGKIADPDLASRLQELIDGQAEVLELLTLIGVSATSATPGRVLGMSGLPTEAGPQNPVRILGDQFGRQIVLTNALRDQVGTQTTTISASTTETTIIASGPAFNDLVMLIVSNTSASTNTRIDFRDATLGTILFSLQSVGGAAPVGFALPVPIPQTRNLQNWTAQCATSTTDVRIYALFIRNQ